MGYITGLASAKTNLQKQSSRGVSGKLPPRKIAFRSGSGFGLGLALELGLGGNFPRTEDRNQDSPETNLGLLQHSR